MFQPKLNYRAFSDDDFNGIVTSNNDNGQTIEKNDIPMLTQKEQIKTIEIYLNKYFNDRGYTDQNKINVLTNNITKTLTSLNFDALQVDDVTNCGLSTYRFECSGKSISLVLVFSSFEHAVNIRITYIYGIDDEVLVTVDRIIYDEHNGADFESDFHALSSRGIYSAILNPTVQSTPFKYSYVYYAFGKIAKEAGEELKLEDKYDHIYDLLTKKVAAYKYYHMKEDSREKYTKDDNTLDCNKIMEENSEITTDDYEIPDMIDVCEENNPICYNLLQFNTMQGKMIPIDYLESFICETVIDSYILDLYNTRYYIKSNIGNYAIDSDILNKINTLIFNYYQYSMAVIDKVSNMSFDKNPIEPLKSNDLMQMNNFVDSDKVDINIINDDKIKDLVDVINNNNEMDKEDKDLIVEKLKKDIKLKYEIATYLTHNTKDYMKYYCPENFFAIFNREDINLNCWANIKRAVSNKNNDTLDDIRIKDDNIDNIAITMNEELRAKYGIEANYDNLRKINEVYIKPIHEAVIDINETIESINNMDMSDEFPDITDYDDEDDDE